MVDLIIDTPDCSGVAIEVTSLTPEGAAKFQDASSKFGGPRGDLNRTWKVRFLRTAKIKEVAPQLIALLRDLEAAGVAQIDLRNLMDEQCFAHRVRQLGAVEVSSVEGPGWILIVDRSVGSAEASGEILTAVATYILKDPNGSTMLKN